jgi:hypothetical protein
MTFDMKLGLPKKMDYQGTFTVSQGAVSVNLPFTMKYELASGEPPQAAVASSTPATPPAASTNPQTPASPAPSASRPSAVARSARPATPAPAPAGEFVPVAGGRFSVRASGATRREPPELAFDGNPKTVWGAGGWPTHWIEVDLLKATPLASIKLIVAQSPASETEHEIWISDEPIGADRPAGKLVHSFIGMTKSDDALEFSFPTDAAPRYVQIRTVKSRSWVAWSEIDIKPL